MKISNSISTAIIAAATGMLQPFIPDLTPTRLIEALKLYNTNGSEEENKKHVTVKKPLTIKEICELLCISRPSVYRMRERGEIRFVKIGGLTRIPVEDVERLLTVDAA